MCGYGLLFPLNKSFLLFFDAVLGTEFNRELRIKMQDTDIAALGISKVTTCLKYAPPKGSARQNFMLLFIASVRGTSCVNLQI
jgi:hypothetical protein